jgi:hypothetical protein
VADPPPSASIGALATAGSAELGQPGQWGENEAAQNRAADGNMKDERDFFISYTRTDRA